MTQHHPFLQALASIVPPFERAVADDNAWSPPSSSSLPELLSPLLRKLAQIMRRRRLLPEGLSSSALVVDRRRDASTILRAIRHRASDYARDKSRAELLFLAAVLLAIALFVIIIPACEALFGPSDDDDDGGEEEDHVPPLSSHSSSSSYCRSSSSPAPSCASSSSSSSCQDEDDYDEYWSHRRQDEGQVVELNDMTFFLHSRFDAPLFGRGGSVGSSGTCHSHGSRGMETIEESSEEEEGRQGEEETEEDNAASSGGTTSDLSSSDSSCPDLDATATEEDDDDDDVVGGCEAEHVADDGTVKYYEFLDFTRS